MQPFQRQAGTLCCVFRRTDIREAALLSIVFSFSLSKRRANVRTRELVCTIPIHKIALVSISFFVSLSLPLSRVYCI